MTPLEPFCRVLLATVFAAAAFGKVRDRDAWEAFADSLLAFGLPPRWPAAPFAAGVVATEAASVVALGASPRLGYAGAALLLAGFTAGMAVVLRRGRPVACRCFGASERPVGPGHLVRNGLLLAAAAAGAALYAPAAPPWGEGAPLAAAFGLLAGYLVTRWEDLLFLFTPGPEAARRRSLPTMTPLSLALSLGGLTTFNALLSAMVVRRARSLQKEVEDLGPPRDAALPKVGAAIPPFEATLADGRRWTDAAVREGPVLVGFFLRSCPGCHRLRSKWREAPPDVPLVSLLVTEPDEPGVPEALAAWSEVTDAVGLAEDAVYRAFGMSDEIAYPTLVLVENGRIAASGHRMLDIEPALLPIGETMTAYWVVAAALAGVGLANLLLNFALVDRVRTLQASVQAPRGQEALPAPGKAVGAFRVEAADGAPITLESLGGGTTLVGFFTAGCKKCERLHGQLLASPPAHPLVALVHKAGDEDEVKALGEKLGRVARVAYFDDDAVPGAFGARLYPTLVRVEGGVVAAAGRRLQDVAA